MIDIVNCPSCAAGDLTLKAEHKYTTPYKEVDFDPLTNDNARKDRLAILFDSIIPDKKSLTIRIMKCNRCSFIFFTPRFTQEDILNKYSRISDLEKALQYTKRRPVTRQGERADRIHKLVSPHLASKQSSVLDFGGGEGWNLVPFSEKGHECHLLDYVEYDAPDGIKYVGKDVKDLPIGAKYDCILFCHTLEHVVNPRESLAMLRDLLSDEGILYVEVPLGAWREWKIVSDPITHLNFYSEESLFRQAELSGLRITHIDSKFQWVTHSTNACINMLCTKASSENGRVAFKRSSTQEGSILLYVLWLWKNPEQILKKLKRLFNL